MLFKKKALAAVLVLLLISSLFPLTVNAESGDTYSLFYTTDKQSYEAGDTVTVSIYLKKDGATDNYPLYQFTEKVIFKTAELEYMGISDLADGFVSDAGTGGKGNYYYHGMNYISLRYQYLSKDGTPEKRTPTMLVAKLKFKALSSGKSTLYHSETSAWNTLSGTNGETVNVSEWVINEGQEPASCTVNFDSLGGTGVASQIVKSGEKAAKPSDPTRNGYTFGGWYKEAACENAWTFDTDTVTSDVKLYAKWTANEATSFSITFNTEGGSAVAGQTVENGGKISKPSDPTRNGYTFGGWYKEAACENAWNFNTDTVSANVILYAKWTESGGNDSGGGGGGSIKPDKPDPNPDPETEYKLPFVDVSKTDYYYDAVKWAVENKITSGVDETHFAPDGKCTRAQMVTFLWRAEGSPEPETAMSPFIDVKEGSYYEKAVLWGVENGYVKGTSETTFSPDDNVTRGQAVTFIARIDGVKDDGAASENKFEDVSAKDYYNNAVTWAVENEITLGVTDKLFAPKDDCLRCQIVVFMYRYYTK